MNSLQPNGFRAESGRSPSAYTRYATLRNSTPRFVLRWNLKSQSLRSVEASQALDSCEAANA